MRKTSVHHWPRGTQWTLCVCARADACVCVCKDCSQLLNINLKVKGRELFDIHAGSVPCAGCWSPTHAAAPIRSLWVIMFATVSPFLSLMCWHNIEPDCLCSQTQNICSYYKGATCAVTLKIITAFKISRFSTAVIHSAKCRLHCDDFRCVSWEWKPYLYCMQLRSSSSIRWKRKQMSKDWPQEEKAWLSRSIISFKF